MMKTRITVLFLLFSMAIYAQPQTIVANKGILISNGVITPPKTHYWIFTGQSNWENQSSAGDTIYKGKNFATDPRIFVNVNNAWVPANHYTNNILGAGTSNAVREASIMIAARKWLIEKPYDTIKIISFGRSNTPLSWWTPKQTGFGEKNDTTNTMWYTLRSYLNNAPAGTSIDAMFWQQGEKNQQDTTLNAYWTMMKEIEDSMKTYPSVNTEMRMFFSYPTTTYIPLRNAIDSVDQGLIDLSGRRWGTVRNSFSTGVDATHFNNKQQYDIGVRMFMAYNCYNPIQTVSPYFVNMNDSALQIKGPGISYAMSIGNMITFVKPFTSTTNALFNGALKVSGASPLQVITTSTTGGQAEVSTTGGTGGNYSAWKCKQGLNSTFNLSMFSGMLNTAGNGGHASIWTSVNGTYLERLRIVDSGRVGIKVNSPTASLHLPASTGAAWTASLKIDAGTLLTTPENGVVEFDGTNFFGTSGGVRYTFQRVTSVPASSSATGVTGSIAYDNSFIYVCVNTNTWVRAALSTW